MYIPQTLYIEVRESSLQFLQKKHYNLNDQGRKKNTWVILDSWFYLGYDWKWSVQSPQHLDRLLIFY